MYAAAAKQQAVSGIASRARSTAVISVNVRLERTTLFLGDRRGGICKVKTETGHEH